MNAVTSPSLHDLAAWIEGSRWSREPSAASWTGASIDSRSIATGQVFFALRGERVDGHRFVGAALKAGAACAVIDDEGSLESLAEAGGVLLVPNVERAMAEAARAFRRSALARSTVLAVTGSNGKTTTCRLLAAACSTPDHPAWLPKSSFNNHLGVPLTLLNAPATSRFVVCEVGTNSPGEIAAMGAVIEPDACAIISVGRAHLEGLGGIAGVAKEKASLSAAVKPGGLVVASAHAPGLLERIADDRRVVTYGLDQPCDRLVRIVEQSAEGCRCLVDRVGELVVRLPGWHNALNAAAAAILAIESGATPSDAVAGIEHAALPPMRLAWETISGVRVLVDAYNANPDSTLAALNVLGMTAGERRIAVLGDMLEMGDHADGVHREVLSTVLCDHRFDLVVCVGACYARVAPRDERLVVHPDAQGAWTEAVAAMLRPGDAVLLKGSRGIALERLLVAMRASAAACGGAG